MARIVLPSAWAVLTAGERHFESDARTLGEALTLLLERFPDIRPRVLDKRGRVPSYTSVFVDDTSLKALDGLETPLSDQSVVTIVPAVVGG